MAEAQIAWPKKTREIVNVICDSTRWNDFPFRDDDIVIDTPGKTGTTWVQQIVGQLLLRGADGLVAGMSPWLDHQLAPKDRILAQLADQKSRRFIKSHLPLDALVFSRAAKYIYIARDARDAAWSMHNHASHFTQTALDLYNSACSQGPRAVRAGGDPRTFYLTFLETGEMPMLSDGSAPWPFWSHVQGWWDARKLPNVMLVHYTDLKVDFLKAVQRIAGFLGIEIEEAKLPRIIEHCGMDYMRAEAKKIDALNLIFEGGADTFINKGTNGRWKDVLSMEEIARCDEVAAKHLTPDCAHWLKNGNLPED